MPGREEHNALMTSLVLLALLLWHWVVERRLHAMSVTVRTLKLDLDGLRNSRNAERYRDDPADPTEPLPQVVNLNRTRQAAPARHPVH
jgi:hypothetical protein